MIASPCNKVCVMDAQSGLCRGCCRTLDEIARWSAMDDTERARVAAALPARREPSSAGQAPRPVTPYGRDTGST